MNIFEKAKNVVYDLASGDKDMMRMSIPIDKDDDDIVLIGAITAGEHLAELLQEAKEYVWMYCSNADDDDNGLLARIDALLKEIEVK